MVTAVTSLGRSGLSDWLIQRFTALVLVVYSAIIVVFLLSTPNLDFEQWSGLFSQLWMRILSLLVLLSIAAHGWIGLWGVLTDYVTSRFMGSKALILRIFILAGYAIISLGFIVWGIEVLWSIK